MTFHIHNSCRRYPLSHSLYSEFSDFTTFFASALLSHREISFFFIRRLRVFSQRFWVAQILEIFRFLAFPMSKQRHFSEARIFTSLQQNSSDLFSFLAFLTFFHNFQGNTLRTHIRHDSFLLSRLLHIIDAFYFIFGKNCELSVMTETSF